MIYRYIYVDICNMCIYIFIWKHMQVTNVKKYEHNKLTWSSLNFSFFFFRWLTQGGFAEASQIEINDFCKNWLIGAVQAFEKWIEEKRQWIWNRWKIGNIWLETTGGKNFEMEYRPCKGFFSTQKDIFFSANLSPYIQAVGLIADEATKQLQAGGTYQTSTSWPRQNNDSKAGGILDIYRMKALQNVPSYFLKASERIHAGAATTKRIGCTVDACSCWTSTGL